MANSSGENAGWSPIDIYVPNTSWELKVSRDKGYTVDTTVAISHVVDQDMSVASTLKITVNLTNTENDKETGNIITEIVVVSQIDGFDREEFLESEAVQTAFNKYIIRVGFGYARAVIMRIGQEAGLASKLVFPYFDDFEMTAKDDKSKPESESNTKKPTRARVDKKPTNSKGQ